MEKPKIGWGKQRHLVFKGKVTAFDGVWSNSCAAMEQDFRSLVEVTKVNMNTVVGDVFANLLNSFDRGCDSTNIDEPAQKELQKLLRTRLVDIKDYIKKELDPAWEALDKSNR